MTRTEQDYSDDRERFDKGAFVTVLSDDGEYTDMQLTADEMRAVWAALATLPEKETTPKREGRYEDPSGNQFETLPDFAVEAPWGSHPFAMVWFEKETTR